jgi:hypothetical protein
MSSDNNNILYTICGIGFMTLIGCLTYEGVVQSNNNKEIVTRAIERGLDPVTAACAGQISTGNKDLRATCEKLAIIKGK